ncbi:MAG: ABC transporter permease, partial [bacterium]
IEVERAPDGTESVSAYQPVPLANALVSEFAEIEKAVQLLHQRSPVNYSDFSAVQHILYTHPEFLEIFSFQLVKGNPHEALSNPTSVVITEALAAKIFGDQEPVGKNIEVSHWRGKGMYTVTGVIESPPPNSSISYEAILPITQYPNYAQRMTRWSSFNGSVYVLLVENANPAALESKFEPFISKYWGEMIERARSRGRMSEAADAMQVRFQPINEIHLDKNVGLSEEPVSNPLYAYILGGIAMLILFVACINFVTLAIGRSSTRAKEVGVRKVLGAARFQLKRQFWGEAALLTIIAMVLGIVLAEFLLPLFNEYADKQIEFRLFANGLDILGMIAIVLLVSLLAGSYPASYLARFQPVEVFAGKLRIGGQNLLTRSLVVFQFGLSICLIICALFMAAQQDFMMNKSLGYNPGQVLALRSFAGSPEESVDRLERFRTALSGLPDVLKVSGVSSSFNRGWSINGFEHKGENRSAFVYKVDYDYLDLFGIELQAGRNFSREMGTDINDAIIVNKAFVEAFEWRDKAIGQRLEGWDKKNNPAGPVVIGVVKDYHFLSLHQEIAPMMLILDPEWPLDDYLLRIATNNMPETIENIRKTWKQVAPNTPFDFAFVDDDVERQYRSEQRWGGIINSASTIAVLLACLGLFGLATLSVNRRTKEIGVRKVLGATSRHIISLVGREFTLLVVLANLIAIPVAR